MTDLDLDAIRRRAAAATPGPWTRHGADVHSSDGASGPLFVGRDGTSAVREQADRDAEFVAAARADVVALLGALDRIVDKTADQGGGEHDRPGPAGAHRGQPAVEEAVAGHEPSAERSASAP